MTDLSDFNADEIRVLWAGAKHYRNTYSGLNATRNTAKARAAQKAMDKMATICERRGIDLDRRRPSR